jgi:hypothetical protein
MIFNPDIPESFLDIYAMNGRPLTALATCVIPFGKESLVL